MTPQQTRHSERVPGLMAENSISVYPNLAKVIGLNEAIILQQIFFYMNVNQRKKSLRHFHDGKWWVYNSYQQWRDEHFVWLTPRGVQNFILKLEEKGILLSIQGVENPYDRRKWYTIDLEALDKVITSSTLDGAIHARSTCMDCTMDMHGLHDDSTETTTETTYREKELQKQTTTKAPDLDETQEDPFLGQPHVVVVEETPPLPDHASGEHCLNSEGQDRFAVKAHNEDEQHRNDKPSPKVAEKGSSALVAELIAFSVAPYVAQRLVDQYPAADVRYILTYARGEHNLHNPPGFVVDELDHGKAGVLAKRNADQKIKVNHETDLLCDDFVIELVQEAPVSPPPPPGSEVIVKALKGCTTTAGRAFELLLVMPVAARLKGARLAAYDPETHTYHIAVPSSCNMAALQGRLSQSLVWAMEPFHDGPFSLVFSPADSGAGQTLNSDQHLAHEFA